ncbi:MAG: L-histidine N(alpha)-methyltransferase [Gemmataceae bacterium]|nr:L-histidine N(alpha)-methyltransferase [Gemmataceae bacterium]
MDRFCLIAADSRDRHNAFARDVKAGLLARPKHLNCCYFYDAEGSALFEAICELPEYYVTRAEREILQAHAGAIADRFPQGVRLVELGSGNSAKTRLLIAAFLQRQEHLQYVPIDICRVVLQESARELLRDYPKLEVVAVAAEYREGLRHLRKEAERPKLVLWLGSNVGNFDRGEAAEFLRQVRDTLGPDDRLLMGVDLRKERRALESAYDDAQGVTADFNLNLLTRINRELGGHFDRNRFRHRAVYNESVGRIEMYLVSTCAHTVRIDALDLEVAFAADEAIHTENSYKYSLAEIDALAHAAGLVTEAQLFDGDRRFSVNLLAPARSPDALRCD